MPSSPEATSTNYEPSTTTTSITPSSNHPGSSGSLHGRKRPLSEISGNATSDSGSGGEYQYQYQYQYPEPQPQRKRVRIEDLVKYDFEAHLYQPISPGTRRILTREGASSSSSSSSPLLSSPSPEKKPSPQEGPYQNDSKPREHDEEKEKEKEKDKQKEKKKKEVEEGLVFSEDEDYRREKRTRLALPKASRDLHPLTAKIVEEHRRELKQILETREALMFNKIGKVGLRRTGPAGEEEEEEEERTTTRIGGGAGLTAGEERTISEGRREEARLRRLIERPREPSDDAKWFADQYALQHRNLRASGRQARGKREDQKKGLLDRTSASAQIKSIFYAFLLARKREVHNYSNENAYEELRREFQMLSTATDEFVARLKKDQNQNQTGKERGKKEKKENVGNNDNGSSLPTPFTENLEKARSQAKDLLDRLTRCTAYRYVKFWDRFTTTTTTTVDGSSPLLSFLLSSRKDEQGNDRVVITDAKLPNNFRLSRLSSILNDLVIPSLSELYSSSSQKEPADDDHDNNNNNNNTLITPRPKKGKYTPQTLWILHFQLAYHLDEWDQLLKSARRLQQQQQQQQTATTTRNAAAVASVVKKQVLRYDRDVIAARRQRQLLPLPWLYWEPVRPVAHANANLHSPDPALLFAVTMQASTRSLASLPRMQDLVVLRRKMGRDLEENVPRDKWEWDFRDLNLVASLLKRMREARVEL